MAEQLEENTVVLIYEQYGVCIPQMFSKIYLEDKRWVGAEDTDIATLGMGPDHPEYWEAWESVLDQVKYVDKDGREWRLWQEGDLFVYTGDGEQWT